jgi:acetolactate synthase-1/3 small subunit
MHILQALVENKFGVLARIASLFSARGYNIQSLAVGETHDPSISCMTIVVNAEDEGILEQIQKQLNKLIDVITVRDLTKTDCIDRELLLVRLRYDAKNRDKVDALHERYTFHLFDKKEDYAVLEFTGDSMMIESLLSDLEPIGVTELVRTGKIAISK